MVDNLNVLFEKFVKKVAYAEKKSPETIRGYEASFQLFSKFYRDIHGAEPTLADLTNDKMIEFFSYLNKRTRKIGKGELRTGVRASTIATYRGKLNVFFKWLLESGHIKVNPFEGIKYPNVRYEDRKYLDKKELQEILVAVDHDIPWPNLLLKKRSVAMITVLCNLGLRKGELLGLKISDLNFKKNWLTVRPETSKSRTMRTLPMNKQVVSALQDYLAERGKKGYQTEFLWVPDNNDKQFSVDGFIHLVRKIKEASGIKKFHVHRFRHTFAVNFYNQTKNLVGLKDLLGHTDIDMTKQYLRALPINFTKDELKNFSLAKAI